MIKSKSAIHFLLFVVTLVFYSCSNSGLTRKNKADLKNTYKQQFKLNYFRQLLIKSYNNSNAVQEIIDKDYSGFAEPILSADDLRMIDSLTNIDNQYLIADSAKGYERAEGINRKRPIGFIIKKMNSKQFDKLIKDRMKILISNHRLW